MTRELAGAVAGTLSYLAVLLSQGLLAYAPLGAAGPALGMPAAFGSVVLGGLVFALLSRGISPAAGPSSATSLILAGLVLQLVQSPLVEGDDAASLLRVVALTSAAVLTMGLAQVAMAALGLARLARYVPQPVLAGFMNGVSTLMIVSQLPVVLGWTPGAWQATGWAAFAGSLPGAVLLAVVTAAAVWTSPRVLRRWPPTLVGLVGGAALAVAVHALLPGVDTGPPIGELPAALPQGTALQPWLGPEAGRLWPHLGAAVTTGLVLALIGSLESLLNGVAIEQATETRGEPTRDLLLLGLGNVVGGLLGALPLVHMRTRAVPAVLAGARTRWSAVGGCAMFALLGTVGLPALAPLPQAVLGGIMVTLALALVDHWSRDQLARWWAGLRDAELLWNLGVVALVCVITVSFGFAAGVLLGVLCSMLLFIRSMNRSLVRTRLSAAERPSRRMHALDDERRLQSLRRRVTLLELEGALFFGSAERLLGELDALPADSAGLVLDLRRVTAIDASGSVVLAQCARRLARRGVPLLLAGVSADDRLGRSLLALSGRGGTEARDWYPDADHAVEALELRLLAAVERPPRADGVALADSDLFRGLDAAARSTLQGRMALRRLDAGEVLFRVGDPADRMYVLCSGSVTVRGAPPADGSPRPRFAVLSPGTMFGETALLDGGGRSGEAVADLPSLVAELTGAELATLRAEAPGVAAAVMTNVARHLSGRLRTASRG